MISAACFAMSAHAGLKSGKYSASGLPCAMLVRSGLKSVSALLIASTAVMVPPAASKFARNAAARPSAYGLSSLIVAAVVSPCFVYTKSDTIAPWILSLCAVRR